MTTKNASKSGSSKAKKAVVGRLLASKKKKTVAKRGKSAAKKMSAKTDKTPNIVDAIKRDHKDLKKFIKTMKDEDVSPSEKREVVEEFVELLKSHASSEETALYDHALKSKDLVPMGNEGYVEHQVATALMKAIEGTGDQNRWVAEVKVLAESVEHHIEEEESEFLPKVKKAFSKEELEEMSATFLTLRERSQAVVAQDNGGVLEATAH